MSRLRFAIMGCGRISVRHCEILSKAHFSDLAAVCDIVQERAQRTGTKYGVPWYLDVEEMIAAVKPTCSVSSPRAGCTAATCSRPRPW